MFSDYRRAKMAKEVTELKEEAQFTKLRTLRSDQSTNVDVILLSIQ